MKLTIARLLPVRGIQRSGGLSYSHGVVTGGGVGSVSESVSTAQGAELPAERVLKKKRKRFSVKLSSHTVVISHLRGRQSDTV